MTEKEVALLVSAWIEIERGIKYWDDEIVALLVSAWIEIGQVAEASFQMERRTPRECVD